MTAPPPIQRCFAARSRREGWERVVLPACGFPLRRFDLNSPGLVLRHVTNLVALRYPSQDKKPGPGEMRAKPHTDPTVLTILSHDKDPGEASGLEVQCEPSGVPNFFLGGGLSLWLHAGPTRCPWQLGGRPGCGGGAGCQCGGEDPAGYRSTLVYASPLLRSCLETGNRAASFCFLKPHSQQHLKPRTLLLAPKDLLHRWTGGTFRSAKHRVINGRDDRLAISYFSMPNYDVVVEPLVTPGHGGIAFPPIQAGQISHFTQLEREKQGLMARFSPPCLSCLSRHVHVLLSPSIVCTRLLRLIPCARAQTH